MSSNTKTITAPAKEHDQSVREPNTTATTSNKHVSNVNGKSKKVSAELNKVLNNIGGIFGKLAVQVELAFKLGKVDGLSENDIAGLVRQKMKEAGYSYKTIWMVLKENHPAVIQQGHKSFTKSKTPGKVLVIPKKGVSGTATAVSIQPVETVTKAQKLENNVKVDQERETKHGIIQFDPQQYLLQDLHTYNHEMLESIVKWQHEANTRLVKALKDLDKENKLLKQENQKLRQGVKTK